MGDAACRMDEVCPLCGRIHDADDPDCIMPDEESAAAKLDTAQGPGRDRDRNEIPRQADDNGS